MSYGLLSLIRAATSEPPMPTTFCASQWPCGSVLLGDFGIGGKPTERRTKTTPART
jgi:hypothetical protein